MIANPDLRDMLRAGGAGRFTADMSIPYMNMLPRTTEPYSQGVIQIVKGLQRLLNKRGARLEVDGGFGQETLDALLPYAGPRWYDKTWQMLYQDVIGGRVWKGYTRSTKRGLQPLTSSSNYPVNGWNHQTDVDLADDLGQLSWSWSNLWQWPPNPIMAVAAVGIGYLLYKKYGKRGRR